MATGWEIVAFPLILPWRREFWTLPLYFAELTVGVIPGWPEATPYRGRPLPPEALVPGNGLRHCHHRGAAAAAGVQELSGKLACVKALEIVPGATHLFEEPGTLEQVAAHASKWLARWLAPERRSG